MKDNFIKDLEQRLSLKGMSNGDIEKVVRCAIETLENYELTAIIKDTSTEYIDINHNLIKRYISCLRLDGKAESSIKAYAYAVNRFSNEVKKPFNEVTTNDIRAFLSNLMDGRKKSYVNTQKRSISGFFKWMTEEEIIDKNPCARIKDIKIEQEIRFPFTSVDIDKLRSSITGRHAVRNRAIIETLLSSGVRCAELCALKRDDIDIKSGTLYVRCGKGGKGRTVFVSEIAIEYINRYLNKRKDNNSCLFYGQRGELTKAGVERMLMKYSKIAQVENVHPHRFRRTFATTMYRRGMDLEELRRLMGHSEVQTTLRYIYTDDSRLKAAYDKYAA